MSLPCKEALPVHYRASSSSSSSSLLPMPTAPKATQRAATNIANILIIQLPFVQRFVFREHQHFFLLPITEVRPGCNPETGRGFAGAEKDGAQEREGEAEGERRQASESESESERARERG